MRSYARTAVRFFIAAVAAMCVCVSVYAAEAHPSDLAQANKFLAELPPACSGSYKYVSSDGTVNIRIKCDGNGKKMDGLVAIKNGVVTKVK